MVPANRAYTHEYGTVCRNPISRIRQIVPTLPSLPKQNRQTVPRIRQIGFRQTGHIPPRPLREGEDLSYVHHTITRIRCTKYHI